ncbi:tetratricopeptide repeat protein [Clostridium polynesiense]|uniref:tetratricopeptide repeat protein n=1 Tax=Clostridium polynesiense TaxID=1325933 RepID=UPI000590D108|nr:tetratricopeptide repeat protein [Clostridium polynesiense]
MKINKSLLLNFFIILFFALISFKFNAYLGNGLLSVFILYKLYSSRAYFYAMLGNANFSKGAKDKALQWFKKASQVKNCPPRVAASYAYLLLKEKDIQGCRNILDKLITKENLNLDEESAIKMTLALVYWKEGDVNLAVETLEEVYSKFKNSTLYESLGYLLILQGDLEKALKFNLEAIDYDDNNDVIKDNLAQSYFRLGQYDKSAEIYEKLTEKGTFFAEPYYYYGLVLKAEGNTIKANEMLKTALSFKQSFLSDLTKDMIQSEINVMNQAL